LKQPKTVRLGYSIPAGEPVELPIRHMVITGQTQEAGKTTALEAMIARSGLRAVVFVTKPGEGSFAGARRCDPYFRERADWQFVASLLEAARREKLKFERAWIIRASRGARTLADVHRNVKEALEKAKGLSADVYLTLDAYLDEIVPQVSAVKWATSVDLAAGVNAMDLSELSTSMQGLVIRSTLEWVLTKEKGTVVVVPEAWKFIPQGRGTPVKLAAEEFIRQGAGQGNYLWLDSQDIAGVEKLILKSVPVWVLGVQRESNEVKRTLDQIPGGVKKPKPADISTLGLGVFFACWHGQLAKVYVQPDWMDAAEARRVAMGEAQPRPDTRPHRAPAPPPAKLPAPPPPAPPKPKEITLSPELERELIEMLQRQKIVRPAEASPAPATGSVHAPPAAVQPYDDADEEERYQRYKARLMREAPALVRVLLDTPSIEVQEARRVVQAKNTEPEGVFALMIRDGYFDSGATTTEALQELRRRGQDVGNNVGATLAKQYAAGGFLTLERNGRYKTVDGVKGRIHERK
jgi:hypothetical protein